MHGTPPRLRVSGAWRRALPGFLVFAALAASGGVAQAQSLQSLAVQLGSEDRKAMQDAIVALGAREEPAALAVLQALEQQRLRVSERGDVLVAEPSGKGFRDALTGKPATASGALREPLVTNTVRRALKTSIAQLSLRSREPAVRLAAAQVVSSSPSADMAPVLRKALERESDGQVEKLLALALAQLDLGSSDAAARLRATKTVAEFAEPSLKPQLSALIEKRADGSFAEPDARVRTAAAAALAAIERHELFVRVARDLVYGLSLGSVLLLAALGLAVTFGLMGVINMAHGEMLMLGAYSTYVVQRVFETRMPGAIDYYLPAALPIAFLVCALLGMALERSVIRFLYGRPLETLLATWGVSLALIQVVRLMFGAANVTVANPSWLSGGSEIMAGVVVPYTRLATILFVAVVVACLWYVLNRTNLGLQVRAITQNRRMARCVGIRTARVDTLTFGIGSGVAGLGGVALSQIGNVGPELGQSYIVDSFMVVVVGGVGSLFGTIFAALGLGAVNKLLEPVSGAVLAKIFVLAFIILFIQRRPQGLFALKGRAAET
jgi:urea transport system permease protein